MSGFGMDAQFGPDVQQQLLQLLQQQQQQQQQQQHHQTHPTQHSAQHPAQHPTQHPTQRSTQHQHPSTIPQSNMQAYAQSQPGYLNGVSAQQLQALLGQRNTSAQSNNPSTPYTLNNLIQPQNVHTPSSLANMNVLDTNNVSISNVPAMNNMNALLADMASKARAGMLTPQQLMQIRSIVEQQQSAQQTAIHQPSPATNPAPTPSFQSLMQPISASQHASPMMMHSQASPAMPARNLSAMNSTQESSQHAASPDMAKGIQFVRTIQQRIRDVEQKLATMIPESERQALQRAHQELVRVQTALVQKLSAQRPTGMQPSMLPNNSPHVGHAMPTSQRPTPAVSSFHNLAQPSQSQSPLMGFAQQRTTTGSPSSVAQKLNPNPTMKPNQNTQLPPPLVSPTQEQFKRALTELMARHGKPFQGNPVIDGRELELYHLFTVVQALGGSKVVSQKGIWSSVAISLGLAASKSPHVPVIGAKIAQIYHTYLELFGEVWNRAMVHQKSMNANNLNENQSQTTQRPASEALLANSNNVVPQANAFNANARTHLDNNAASSSFIPYNQSSGHPINANLTQENNLQSEQLARLLQQHREASTAKMQGNSNMPYAMSAGNSNNAWQNMQSLKTATPSKPNDGAQPVAVKSTHANPTQPAKQPSQTSSNNPSPEKLQRPRTKVTPKMLEEAESMLRRIDASLAASRPRLPVIEDMSDAERSQVLEQIQKLVSLKATVMALLPAFLAMTGSIEPAKRVKIMICMFDDQLALVPKRRCILRLSDLEKLKTQMTRCIGFVRVNDDKLAQQIVAKASQELAQRAAKAKQQSIQVPGAESQQSKRVKVDVEPNASTDMGLPSSESTANFASQQISNGSKPSVNGTSHTPITTEVTKPETFTDSKQSYVKAGGALAQHDASTNPMQSMRDAEYARQQEEKLYQKLAQESPMEFVKKTWADLIDAQQKAAPSQMTPVQQSDQSASTSPMTLLTVQDPQSLLSALVQAPYDMAKDFQEAMSLQAKQSTDTSPTSANNIHGLLDSMDCLWAVDTLDLVNASQQDDQET